MAGQMHSVAAVRAKAVDGDAVAELFERDGQRGGRPSLVVVHGEAVRIGVDGGTGGVDQDEHAEIAGELAALQVDVLGSGEAGVQIDEQIDERLDVEVVAIGTAAQDLRAEPDASQASPQHVVVRDTGIGDVGGDGQRKVDDPAPVRLVPVVVDVPLRVQGAAHAHRSTGLAVVGEAEPGGERPGVRPDSCTRRIERTVISPPAAPSPGEREPPNILRKKSDIDWLLKSGLSNSLRILLSPGFPPSSSVVVVASDSGMSMGSNLQLEVLVGGLRAGPGGCAQQPGGFDDTEPLRRVGDLGSALGHLE